MRRPTLAELPPPPPRRAGWPWNEECAPLPDAAPDGSAWPLLSIVTPSYNQGAFLEETIRSVLLQGYPNIEYIIMDGGSADNSISIIKKYKHWISHWVSEKDGGQTQALNKGFSLARGDLVGWQNSDDFYDRDAFAAGALASLRFPDDDVFFGENDYVDASSALVCRKKISFPTYEAMIPWPCISNQSMFFRRAVFERGLFLDEGFQHYMDYEFFWRLLLRGLRFHHVPEMNGMLRTHAEAKGVRQGAIAQAEGFKIYKWLVGSAKMPPRVRERLLDAMRRECINDFGHYRAATYRRHFFELMGAGGLNAVTPELVARFIVALFGARCIRLVVDRKKRCVT